MSIVLSALSLALAGYALLGWRQRGDARDLYYSLTLLAWSALLATDTLSHLGASAELVRTATRVAYQFTILWVSIFLVSWVSDLHWGDRLLMAGQAALGLVLVVAPGRADWLVVDAGQAWFWLNVSCVAVLVLRLAHAIWRRTDTESWMVLILAAMGLSVMLTDLQQIGDGPVPTGVSHYFFALAMFLLWLKLTRRVGSSAPAPDDRPMHRVRRLLAQELHDGVGSQLTTIISALDAGSPEQRATAASLQQCLLELKLLVDGISEEGSVVSHLASLRYRIQPQLATAGIALRWQLHDDDELERAQGPAARQVLRIAQEALANAVRHSGCDTVVVRCCYKKDRDILVLEVLDNGRGMTYERYARAAESGADHHASRGKGLSGMVLRALQIGGQLHIESAPGEGSCVQLLVPMDSLRPASSENRHEA